MTIIQKYSFRLLACPFTDIVFVFHPSTMAARNGGGFAQNRAAEDVVDAQNREYHDRLASKTSYLKGLALDIEGEAKDHHRRVDRLKFVYSYTT